MSTHYDAVIVGAGFAGMYQIHRLRDLLKLNVRCFESSPNAGGTWNWNRYPGARVDVRSAEYSYSFDDKLQQEWVWKEVYAPQPELFSYVEHVLERYDLKKSISFSTKVKSAKWNDSSKSWNITVGHTSEKVHSINDILPGKGTGESDDETVEADFLILATGCLSAPNLPKWPGFETYKGEIFHTARWPTEGHDFKGKKVAVIGTGSSAVQSIPVIAKEAAELTVFQRTATYSIPAHNKPLKPEDLAYDKAHYAELRERQKSKPGCLDWEVPTKKLEDYAPDEIEAELEKRWQAGGLTFGAAFVDAMTNKKANDELKKFVHKKIKSIVKDPKTAELLCPDQVVSCKRLCIDTGYYPTYNLPHVKLVSVKETPIKDVGGPKGMITLEDGTEHGPFDAIVCATGFDAMTGAVLKIDIQGKAGTTLKDKWSAGPLTMLGLMVDQFPNMFLISGPGSPSVLTNMIPSIEQMVEYVSDIIAYCGKEGIKTIEPTSETVNDWVKHVNEVANGTLYPTGCNSWYLGANVPGKPRIFMPYVGGFPAYKQKCDEILAAGFPGFTLGK